MAGILKVDQVQSDSNLAFAIAGSNVAFMNATSLQMVGSNVSLAGTNVITSGKVVFSGMPVGSVLQVVQGVTSTEVTSSLATYVNTGLSASITPRFSTSKILVMVTHGTITKSNGLSTNRVMMKLLRDSTDLAIFGNGLLYTATALQNRGSAVFNYLDSPATTSSITYKTQFANGDAAAEVQVQTNNSASSITLMEIAA
jgi:hypothetical protein